MRVSALEEYGLRCLLHVAREFETDQPVTAQSVADSEGLSVPYAQKILRLLSQADLVESRRGVNGGYVLARNPERISVGDVMRAFDTKFDAGDICERHTGDLEVCAHAGGCTIKPVWSFIDDFITRTLNGLTLDVLLEGDDAVNAHLGKALKPNAKAPLYCPVAEL